MKFLQETFFCLTVWRRGKEQVGWGMRETAGGQGGKAVSKRCRFLGEGEGKLVSNGKHTAWTCFGMKFAWLKWVWKMIVSR